MEKEQTIGLILGVMVLLALIVLLINVIPWNGPQSQANLYISKKTSEVGVINGVYFNRESYKEISLVNGNYQSLSYEKSQISKVQRAPLTQTVFYPKRYFEMPQN